jgi:PIN domain nuclease of toxin-antitoxin system
LIWLDAYGLIAFLADEVAAEEVERLLRSEPVSMTSLNLAEAVDVLARTHGQDLAASRRQVRQLVVVSLHVEPVTEQHAWTAAAYRTRHYERRTQAVSLADCVLLAAAEPGDGVATADPAVARVARLESIRLVALPDRAGRLP